MQGPSESVPYESENSKTTEPESIYLIGDSNGDGKVNVKDATAIQKWVAGIPVNFPIGEEIKK